MLFAPPFESAKYRAGIPCQRRRRNDNRTGSDRPSSIGFRSGNFRPSAFFLQGNIGAWHGSDGSCWTSFLRWASCAINFGYFVLLAISANYHSMRCWGVAWQHVFEAPGRSMAINVLSESCSACEPATAAPVGWKLENSESWGPVGWDR